MWPLIYEKACAKKAGCYDRLSAIRRGEPVFGMPTIQLPADACPSARRGETVQTFLTPALSAATISGAQNAIEDFAMNWMEAPIEHPSFPDVGKSTGTMSLPMVEVGEYAKYSFPLRTPTISVKISQDTWIKVECTASEELWTRLIVCVVEVSENTWRLHQGVVAEVGTSGVTLETHLKASGSTFLVFAGTPASEEGSPSFELELAGDADFSHDFAAGPNALPASQ
jgi:hypothetical protein